jgi:hypothetical protein
MQPNKDTVSETIQQRGQIYGEPHHSHRNIGLSWTGILQQHYGITLPTAIPPPMHALPSTLKQNPASLLSNKP